MIHCNAGFPSYIMSQEVNVHVCICRIMRKLVMFLHITIKYNTKIDFGVSLHVHVQDMTLLMANKISE